MKPAHGEHAQEPELRIQLGTLELQDGRASFPNTAFFFLALGLYGTTEDHTTILGNIFYSTRYVS